MKDIISNKFFIISIGFVFAQQIAVGLSTYFIGKAGESVSVNSSDALLYTEIFFLSIFIAYILGSLSLFYRVKISNSLWNGYYLSTLDEISLNHSYANEKNKSITHLWISGEALSTFDEVGFEFIEIIAVYFNVIFTTVAFFFILGAELAGVILFCMLLSFSLLRPLKGKIGMIGSEMQRNKVTAFHEQNMG